MFRIIYCFETKILSPFLIDELVGATSETPNFGVVKQAAEADAGVKTEQVETNKQTDQNVVAAEGDANKANGAVADQAQQKQVKQPTQGEDEMIKLIKIHQINR